MTNFSLDLYSDINIENINEYDDFQYFPGKNISDEIFSYLENFFRSTADSDERNSKNDKRDFLMDCCEADHKEILVTPFQNDLNKVSNINTSLITYKPNNLLVQRNVTANPKNVFLIEKHFNNENFKSEHSCINKNLPIAETSQSKTNPDRILERDGFHKKIKTRAMKFLKKIFNSNLKKNRNNLQTFKLKLDFNSKSLIKNLPYKEFTSNVTINFNKRVLDMKIVDIYTTDWVKENSEINGKVPLNLKNNREIVILCIKNFGNLTKEFQNFLNSKLSEQFENYFNSKEFQDDKLEIEKSQYFHLENSIDAAKFYMKKFEIHVFGSQKYGELGFLEYFRNSRGNQKKNSL